MVATRSSVAQLYTQNQDFSNLQFYKSSYYFVIVLNWPLKSVWCKAAIGLQSRERRNLCVQSIQLLDALSIRKT